MSNTKATEIVELTNDSRNDEGARRIYPEVVTLSSDSEPEPEEESRFLAAPPSPSISVRLSISRRKREPKTPSPTKDVTDGEVASPKSNMSNTKANEIIDLTNDSSDDEDARIYPEVITLSSDSEPEPEDESSFSSAPPSPSISVCLSVSRREWDPKTPSPTKDIPDGEVASPKKIPLSSECVTPRGRKTPRVRDLFAGCKKKPVTKPKPRRNLAKILAEAQKAATGTSETSTHDIPSTSGGVVRFGKRNRNVKVDDGVKPKRMRTIKKKVQEPLVPTNSCGKSSKK